MRHGLDVSQGPAVLPALVGEFAFTFALVYVVLSPPAPYVGSTWDLERRVSEHNLGLGAKFTQRRRPVRLLWHAYYDSIAKAYAMEKRIQGWRRDKRLALIEGRLTDLPGLSRGGQT